MEKLTCTSCGATMTPNTTEPYLVCEYCDSAMENKYYIQPAADETDALEEELLEEEADEEYQEDEALYAEEVEAEDEPTLIEKIIDAGKNLLTGGLTQGVTYTTYAQPVTYVQPRPEPPRQPEPRPARPVQQPRPQKPVQAARPTQHSKPGLNGQQGMHQRPDRPSGGQAGRPNGNRPQGGGHGGGRPGGGHGGRGGQGGPGRR